MNCSDVIRLLDFEDVAARPDLVALRAHLEDCPACAARYPDAVLAFEDAQRPEAAATPRQRPEVAATVALAAALVLGALGLLRGHAPERSDPPVSADSLVTATDPGRVRVLPAHVSRVTRVSARSDGDRVVVASLTSRRLPPGVSPFAFR